MSGHAPTAVAWDDPRVLASPIPAITRDYLLAVARLEQGKAPPRSRLQPRPEQGIVPEEQRGPH